MKKIFTLLLLSTLLLKVHAGAENNPPLCPPHDYGGEYTEDEPQCSFALSPETITVTEGAGTVNVSAYLYGTTGTRYRRQACGKCGDVKTNGSSAHNISVSSATINYSGIGTHNATITATCSTCGATASCTSTVTVTCDHDWEETKTEVEIWVAAPFVSTITTPYTAVQNQEFKYATRGDPYQVTTFNYKYECKKCGAVYECQQEKHGYDTLDFMYITESGEFASQDEISETRISYPDGIPGIGRCDIYKKFTVPGEFMLIILNYFGPITMDYPAFVADYLVKADADGDSLPDEDEIGIYYTNPNSTDSDGDGISDNDEILVYFTDPNDKDGDKDGDGLSDVDEILVYITQHNNASGDKDSDGLSDADEILIHHTEYNNAYGDKDSDGLSDADEILIYNTQHDNADSDNDGLSDGAEANHYHTNPNNPDQDNDGWIDGLEIEYYYNLNNAPENDTDTDSFSNYLESVLELDDSKTQESSTGLNLIIY